jgi:malate dehydrogenase
MSFIAILGAGAIGGALAHRLASRARVAEVRLIDGDGTIAQGKALDIQQSSPIEGFGTRVSSATVVEAAAGADVIVLADAARGTEHAGEPGLALVRRLAAIETSAPIVFAGAMQRELMVRAIGELHLDRRRIVGSSPAALESSVRALVALEINGSPSDVQVLVVGVPPQRAVIGWESATASGQPLSAHVPAHRLAAISMRLPSLWPPGPQVLSSAAARVAEALAVGSRRRYSCFVAVDEPSGRGLIAALPVEFRAGAIERVVRPPLSRQELTQLENALGIPDR